MNLDFSLPCGDPFVENGRLGLTEFAKKNKFKDEDELKANLERILKLYTQIWAQSKLSSFWLHGANKRPAKETLKKIDEALKNKPIMDSPCVCCGKKEVISTEISSADRTILPLGFSAPNSNFSSSFQEAMICKNCFISLLALPLNTVQVDGKLLFIISSNEINGYWTEKNIREIDKMFFLSPNESLIISETRYIENFIYIFLEELVENVPNSVRNDISFYHFTNFGASPDIQIYHIYTDLISFMQEISPKYLKDQISGNKKVLNLWNNIVRSSFKFLKLENDELYFQDKKEFKNISFNEAKKLYKNVLISKFINGKDIRRILIRKFINDMKDETNEEKLKDLAQAYRILIFKYLIKVKHMNKERLDFLKEVAAKIATLQNAKKRLNELGRQRTLSEFRTLLIRIFQDYAKESNDKLLFSADDFVLKILPADSYFAETRDILFVAIFEQMANNLTKDEIDEMKIIQGEDNE